MFKVLFWLLFDAFFTYALFAFWGELDGFKFLLIAAVAFFTWELIQSIIKLRK